MIATQLTIKIPFSLDVVYESGSFIERDEEMSGVEYTKELDQSIKKFDDRFEETFALISKGYVNEFFYNVCYMTVIIKF